MREPDTHPRHAPGPLTRAALLGPPVLLACAGLVALGARLAGAPPAAAHEDAMPAVDLARQRALCLTPAGAYTAADVRANGGVTPAERYGFAMPRHDAHPAPGDRTCPITVTKADPRFTWTVGGRRYAFCCPACIPEFVARARTSNKRGVAPPEAYVRR